MKKTAFVTGAGGDIGGAAARRLAAEGYSVALGYCSSKEKAEQLADELCSRGCDAFAIKCDVSDSKSMSAAAELIKQRFGSLTLLVNNAGIASFGLFTDSSYEDISSMISTDLLGAMELSRLFLPGMINNKHGCIINISSVWGEKGASCEVAYSAAKAGLIGFTKALAREAGPSGVRVNCISCGFIDTKMNSRLSDEEKQAVVDEIALDRVGTCDDVAGTIAFLAGEDSGYISGQVIRVDGCWI